MTTQKKKAIRGRKPQRLKIKGDWAEAVGKALKKQRPQQGWPTNQTEKATSKSD